MDDAMRDLLEVAARIARREYLPNLDRCRTVSDVRKEVHRYDDYHGHLAMRLKSVWDELKANEERLTRSYVRFVREEQAERELITDLVKAEMRTINHFSLGGKSPEQERQYSLLEKWLTRG